MPDSASASPVRDLLRRPMLSLRVSVTDRCNLRCQYCMPEEEYAWVEREQILSFEEILELIGIFTELGVEKIRLTGGEPLLRHNLSALVGMIARHTRIRDLALTTNGVLLARQVGALREAGLGRLTVSLDTLRPERFQALARSRAHAAVLEGIRAARQAGFERIKINSVILRGVNDDELCALIDFGREMGAEIRFIEYMDVGGATQWSLGQVVTRDEMLGTLELGLGRIRRVEEGASFLPERSQAPAERFALEDGTTFGIIASTTQPFCRACDRSRLTTDGIWYLCLYAAQGVDLRSLLRRGASPQEMRQAIQNAWEARSDRGAEERRQLSSRGILLPVERLRQDPHQEMHTRGG